MLCYALGRQNDEHAYRMGSSSLKSITLEKDLGVLFDSSIKCSNQCAVAVRNANRILGLIRRNILHKSKDVILRLYKFSETAFRILYTSLESLFKERRNFTWESSEESYENGQRVKRFKLWAEIT